MIKSIQQFEESGIKKLEKDEVNELSVEMKKIVPKMM